MNLIEGIQMLNWIEIREWVKFVFIVIAGLIALKAYLHNNKQRKFENALKLIALFHEKLEENDLAEWQKLFRSSSELSGASYGFYINDTGNQQHISDYFCEGSKDNFAISRIADNLELICNQITEGFVDTKLIYFELGQLLETIHNWLEAIPSENDKTKNLLLESFPHINRVHKKYKDKFSSWPCRVFSHIE